MKRAKVIHAGGKSVVIFPTRVAVVTAEIGDLAGVEWHPRSSLWVVTLRNGDGIPIPEAVARDLLGVMYSHENVTRIVDTILEVAAEVEKEAENGKRS